MDCMVIDELYITKGWCGIFMKKYKKIILIFAGVIFVLVIIFVLSNVIYDYNKDKANISKLEQDIMESVKCDNEIDEDMMTYTWAYMNQDKGNMAIAAVTIKGNISNIHTMVVIVDGYIRAEMYVDNINDAVRNNTDFDNWESYRAYLAEKYFLDDSDNSMECAEKFLNKIKG